MYLTVTVNSTVYPGGHLVTRLHIAGWWVCYTFKSEMVSDTIWVSVLPILIIKMVSDTIFY